MWNQDSYTKTLLFAAKAHQDQNVPESKMNYVTHVTNVTMEVANALVHSPEQALDGTWAIQCALLHDVIEDTPVTYEYVLKAFGQRVADGVLALTKNTDLPTKKEQMQDSLQRIVAQGAEIRIVKMADRINNLQRPLEYWSEDRKKYNQAEAQMILDTLGGINPYIEQRLAAKIENYNQWL